MSALKTFAGEIEGEVPIPGALPPYRPQVEDVTRDCENGYHPIELYETLNDRYKVVHKLGHGTHSTTWLAVDNQTGHHVAVKVGTADSTTCDGTWFRRLNRPGSFDANMMASVIPPCRDTFVVNGPPFLAKKSEQPKRSTKSASAEKSARAEKPAKPKKPQDSKESKERLTTASDTWGLACALWNLAVLGPIPRPCAFRPNERATAKDVLDSIWMTRWSRPSHQKFMDLVNEIRAAIREDWDSEDAEDWSDAEWSLDPEDEMDMDGDEPEDSDDTEDLEDDEDSEDDSEDDSDSDSDSEDENMDDSDTSDSSSDSEDSSSDSEDSDDSEDL